MVIAAHAQSRRGEAVFCHLTALDVHRLPLAQVPEVLNVRATTRGRVGTVEPVSPYVNEAAVRHAADLLGSDPRHRRLRSRIPRLPAVRRHGNLLRLGAGQDSAVQLPVTLRDGTWLADVYVDSLPATLASVFSMEPLTVTTAPADVLLQRRVHDLEALTARARDLVQGRAARHRFDMAVGFADARAESVGESLSRALFHELGFVIPELQVEFRAPSGEFLGRPDFWWKQVRLIGEFDGMTKYTSPTVRADRTAEEVLVAERRRELKLAGPDRRVIRWMWKDLMDEAAFARQLAEAGVPRAR